MLPPTVRKESFDAPVRQLSLAPRNALPRNTGHCRLFLHEQPFRAGAEPEITGVRRNAAKRAATEVANIPGNDRSDPYLELRRCVRANSPLAKGRPDLAPGGTAAEARGLRHRT